MRGWLILFKPVNCLILVLEHYLQRTAYCAVNRQGNELIIDISIQISYTLDARFFFKRLISDARIQNVLKVK